MTTPAVGLFDSYSMRGVEFRNRAWVSPMCMYSCTGGVPTEWHLSHLGAFARGGAGLVMVEATGVTPEGRITSGCSGMWGNEHIEAYLLITRHISSLGSVPGIQLAHAGRKGSATLLWEGDRPMLPTQGGWETIAPSAIPFPGSPVPRAMTHIDIEEFVSAFVSSARRAIQAGFRVIEIHAAHGYLLHEFMSPLSNHRMDEYGGSLDNRIRLTVELAREVRREIGDDIPLFVRVSATDWLDGGWTVADTVHLGIRLREAGVDLVDCSSGAIVDNVDIDVYEGYQVPLAREVRKGAGIATAAVGLITRAAHADEVIRSQGADAVFLGRALLRNPHWPLLAAEELGVQAPWPIQYLPASRRRRP